MLRTYTLVLSMTSIPRKDVVIFEGANVLRAVRRDRIGKSREFLKLSLHPDGVVDTTVRTLT